MVNNNPRHHHGFIRRYGHLILLTVLYALISGAGFALVDLTMGYSMIVTLPVIVSTLVMISAWTVFGPAQYWVSFVVGQLFGVVIASACICGFKIGIAELIDSEFWTTATLIVGFSFVPTATVACQIPLWFFRGVLGWRFTYRNESASSSLSLRDLFLITLVFAIGVTLPQYAANFLGEASMREDHLATNTYEQVTAPDGTIRTELVPVEPEIIDNLRETTRKETLSIFYSVALSYCIALAIASLLSAPLIWFVFRIRNRLIAALFITGYGATFLLLTGAVYLFTYGLAFFLNQALFDSSFFIGSTLVCFVLPMALSRYSGFRLTTARDRAVGG